MKTSFALMTSAGLLLAGPATSQPTQQDCGLMTNPATGLITRLPGTAPSLIQQAQMQSR